jgi:hypothetical protein
MCAYHSDTAGSKDSMTSIPAYEARYNQHNLIDAMSFSMRQINGKSLKTSRRRSNAREPGTLAIRGCCCLYRSHTPMRECLTCSVSLGSKVPGVRLLPLPRIGHMRVNFKARLTRPIRCGHRESHSCFQTVMRPVVSYDDITNPQPPTSIPEDVRNSSNPPPSKKRRRNNSQKNHVKRSQQNKYPQQHWDDPGTSGQQFNYDEGDNVPEVTEAEVETEESRELTHDEIWDDSALIDAWNAATEEYEVIIMLLSYSIFTNLIPRHIMAQIRAGRKNQPTNLRCAFLFSQAYLSDEFILI